jgi:hypothetical protein
MDVLVVRWCGLHGTDGEHPARSVHRLWRPAAVLDSIDCDVCVGTGFRLEADGSFQAGPRWQRLRCEEGPSSWATSHVFRKTVATRLDDAGFTPRQVADQFGHANPSMTLDVYFGRQRGSSEGSTGNDAEPRATGTAD